MTRLSEQTSRLVRDEVKLAKTEIEDSVKHAGLSAAMFSVAGVLGWLGLAVLVATTVIVIDPGLSRWLSVLIVAGVLVAAAAVAAVIGKK